MVVPVGVRCCWYVIEEAAYGDAVGTTANGRPVSEARDVTMCGTVTFAQAIKLLEGLLKTKELTSLREKVFSHVRIINLFSSLFPLL